jgi:hypothetical protein
MTKYAFSLLAGAECRITTADPPAFLTTVSFFSTRDVTEANDEAIVADIIASHERDLTLSVAECEQCGRLWVQRSPGQNSYRSFAPDEGGYAGILWSKAVSAAEPDVADDRPRE